MAADAPDVAPAAPSQRLVIKDMVLENFKSYAGAQRVGPFHKVRGWAREGAVARVRQVVERGGEGRCDGMAQCGAFRKAGALGMRALRQRAQRARE